jgi:hypothetical protein
MYPQIGQSVADLFKIEFRKSQSVTGELTSISTDKLLRSCTFTHFVEFIKIDDDLKRTFYEAGLDENLFVSKYRISLPSVEEMETFIKDELVDFEKNLEKDKHDQRN